MHTHTINYEDLKSLKYHPGGYAGCSAFLEQLYPGTCFTSVILCSYTSDTLYDKKYPDTPPQEVVDSAIDITVRAQTDKRGGKQVFNHQCKVENVKWEENVRSRL